MAHNHLPFGLVGSNPTPATILTMSKKNQKIEIGDIVCVNFNNSQYTLCSRARVDHIPVANGDSWQFYDLSTNKVHYVSEGCTVTLLDG